MTLFIFWLTIVAENRPKITHAICIPPKIFFAPIPTSPHSMTVTIFFDTHTQYPLRIPESGENPDTQYPSRCGGMIPTRH